MMKINQNVLYDVKQGASLTTGKILYDRATKFRALGFFMFFCFFHSLSLFLHRANGIDECEKFHSTQFHQNTLDQGRSIKYYKMTFFLVLVQKICTIMRKNNQTVPYVVKQGASVCTEEIPHNPTTKFKARGFFWVFCSLILFTFIEFSTFRSYEPHVL